MNFTIRWSAIEMVTLIVAISLVIFGYTVLSEMNVVGAFKCYYYRWLLWKLKGENKTKTITTTSIPNESPPITENQKTTNFQNESRLNASYLNWLGGDSYFVLFYKLINFILLVTLAYNQMKNETKQKKTN